MPEPQLTPHCRRCGSPFVRPTSPRAPSEYLACLIRRAPYQCQVCAHRFQVPHAGRRASLEGPDRRHYDRLATCLPVTVSGEDGAEAAGVVTDLSLAGCQLHTRTPVAVGDALCVVLHPTDTDGPIVIERAVVRSVHPPAIGMQFVQFTGGGRAQLSQLVRTLLIAQHATA